MPELANRRHELFARSLAAGVPSLRAYEAAGYKPNNGSPYRLQENIRIKQRASELMQETAERALPKFTLTRAWIVEQLIENITIAKQNNDLGPANKAIELLGKELGMFIDRKEVGAPGEFENIQSNQQLVELMRQRFGDAFIEALTKPAQLIEHQAGPEPMTHRDGEQSKSLQDNDKSV
jgi:hypothetical protein